jgi:hypothetical protein
LICGLVNYPVTYFTDQSVSKLLGRAVTTYDSVKLCSLATTHFDLISSASKAIPFSTNFVIIPGIKENEYHQSVSEGNELYFEPPTHFPE